jgi:transposase
MCKEKRNKFSIEEKEKVVVLILMGKESYSLVARKLQTSHRLIFLWVDCYKMNGKVGLSLKNDVIYTEEFKLGLLQKMLNEGLSLQQLSVKYLISPSVILTWKRQYNRCSYSFI